MESDEFMKEIKAFQELYEAEFPPRQTTAWFRELRSLSIAEFRDSMSKIKRSLESLPFKWNLVAAIQKSTAQMPEGKPLSFEPPVQDNAYWAEFKKNLDKAKANFTPKNTDDFEEKRQAALKGLAAESDENDLMDSDMVIANKTPGRAVSGENNEERKSAKTEEAKAA